MNYRYSLVTVCGRSFINALLVSFFFFSLLALPQAIISGDHLTVGAGEQLMLHCNVTGEPYPQVVWSHNDDVITNSSRTLVSVEYCRGHILKNIYTNSLNMV